MKILIVSDIHAMSKDLLDLTESTSKEHNSGSAGGYSGDTRGNVFVEERSTRKNRLLAIPGFLENAGLSGEIDCMICLGDLAHQCKKAVLQIIWQQLNDIAKDLNITDLLAVSGNHDVAAHGVDFENGSPSAILNLLRPPFPLENEQSRSDYHSQKFTLIEQGDIGIVLIDTTSLLGYLGKDQSDLWAKGFVSDEMIDAIETQMKQSSCSAFIVAMHHHPAPVHNQSDTETDYIANGANLLKVFQDLGKPTFVMHGHKHFVSFRRYSEASNAPWILSASSLAAKPYPKMEEIFKCQFHILDIELEAKPRQLSGQIRSWDWVSNQWEKAGSSGMTHLIGFGRTATISEIAEKIFSEVKDGGTLRGKAAFAKVSDLKLLTQDDISDLQRCLKDDHSVEMIQGNGAEVFSFYVEEG